METASVQHEKSRKRDREAGDEKKKKKRRELSLGFERAKANLLFWPFMPQAYIDI